MTQILLVAIFAATLQLYVYACSDIRLNLKNETISARTMDFTIDLRSIVEVVPRGTLVQELVVNHCTDCPDYGWRAKYGYVGLNIFGINVAADGMNEAGLSASWLYLISTKYPIADSQDPRPVITSLVSYFLGNFGNIADVKAGLDKVQFAEFDPRLQTLFNPTSTESRFPLHVALHDAEGGNLVIEFLDGKLHVYDNPGGVLTNDPPLEAQLAAYKAHGDKPLPGSQDSTDRFIRLRQLNEHANIPFVSNTTFSKATPEQAAISTALHVINTVAIQTGFVSSGEATQYTVIRDHKRRTLYFLANENQVLRRLQLADFNLTDPASRHGIPVTFGDWYVDVTASTKASQIHSVDLPPRSIVEKLLPNTTNLSSSKSPIPGFLGGALKGFVCVIAVVVLAFYFLRPRNVTHDYIPLV